MLGVRPYIAHIVSHASLGIFNIGGVVTFSERGF